MEVARGGGPEEGSVCQEEVRRKWIEGNGIMTVQINFILHGGGEYEDVEGTSTSCLTVQQPLTLR